MMSVGEYVHPNELREAVAAETQRWLRWAASRTCCEAGLVAAPDPCPWHDPPHSRPEDAHDNTR
jgi:hypothetical protein